jgi:GNAT superfamily N-acetyltransferase
VRVEGFPAIRAIREADEAELQQFVRNLSLASRYPRFMAAIRELPEAMLDRFVHPDPGHEVALVACSPTGAIVGLAQYVADESGDGCEVAIVVADAWQRIGLGTILLATLISIARHYGITHVHADVLADNYAMLALARKLGCEVRTNMSSPFLSLITKTVEAPRGAERGGRWKRGFGGATVSS